MAGMYPDNQVLEVFGKEVTWPGVDKSNVKFTNGDFNDPLVPPSYIPADTINLVVDNLNTLVTSMGGEPNNTEEEQLAALFSAAAVPLSGIKRDAHGRAQVAAPVAADDIARKADIDGANETSASHAAGRGINAHGATATAAAGQIITRDVNGRAEIEVPTTQKHIANKEYVDTSLPAGMIIASPRSNVPGYLICNGSNNVSRTTYARLFEAMRDIGFPYGAGDSWSTFTLPDFRGCFLRGADDRVGANVADVGVKQGDAIRNITGTILTNSANHIPTGAFYDAGNTDGGYSSPGGSFDTIGFDASLTPVPTANENRPVNHAINWFIKY